jgi:hypothetical protein
VARRLWHDRRVLNAISIVLSEMSDLIGWFGLVWRPRKSLEAEILFLRRQLALYTERRVRPRRIDAATRVSLALLSRLFDWRSALVVVRPETRCAGTEPGSGSSGGGSLSPGVRRFRQSYDG